MNLVWVALLAIAPGGFGPTAEHRPVAAAQASGWRASPAESGPSISPATGHGRRSADGPCPSFEGEARDLDEDEADWPPDLGVLGLFPTGIGDWGRPASPRLGAGSADRRTSGPGSVRLRC